MEDLDRTGSCPAGSCIDEARIRADERAKCADEIERLRAALKPFADFADRKDRPFPIPDDTVISAGSTMARRQLTLGECRRARDVLVIDN